MAARKKSNMVKMQRGKAYSVVGTSYFLQIHPTTGWYMISKDGENVATRSSRKAALAYVGANS